MWSDGQFTNFCNIFIGLFIIANYYNYYNYYETEQDYIIYEWKYSHFAYDATSYTSSVWNQLSANNMLCKRSLLTHTQLFLVWQSKDNDSIDHET